MAITAIKDFKIKQAYTKLIEKALSSYLWEGIYEPMFEIMNLKKPKAQNEYNPIQEALINGNIFYIKEAGGFKAKIRFTSAQSRILKNWGAQYNSREKMWKIHYEKLPQTILVAIAQNQTFSKEKINAVAEFLKEVENNLPYLVETMVFDKEVITILDDAGNEVKKNVKHLKVIKPELSEKQKQEIARTYTENMKDYVIKDFAQERIPEMRRKIQELVLQGYRIDKVQELLQKEYGIAARKAKFLAQNETAIMLAEYKKVTYKEMGFNKFIWKTIMDGKERELHKQLNNTVWSYDDPPVIDERTGQKGLPGETYNCRCEQVPFRDDSFFIHKNLKSKKDYEKYLAKK